MTPSDATAAAAATTSVTTPNRVTTPRRLVRRDHLAVDTKNLVLVIELVFV